MDDRIPAGILIAKIKQLQERIFQDVLKEHGLEDFNSAQSRILYVLWNNDNISITDLSKKTSLAKTTLTSMLDRLEKINLIEKVYNPQDRREVKIILSNQAKKLEEAYLNAHHYMRDINFRGFSLDEALTFENMLQRVLDNLENYSKD